MRHFITTLALSGLLLSVACDETTGSATDASATGGGGKDDDHGDPSEDESSDSGGYSDGTSGASGTTGSSLDTCDADLQNDPRHCGACEVSCLGGGCFEGACEPVPLLTTARWWSVAVRGDLVAACDGHYGTFARQRIGDDGPEEVVLDDLGFSTCWGSVSEHGMARIELDSRRLDMWSWDAVHRSYEPATGHLAHSTAWLHDEVCFRSFDTGSHTRQIQCIAPASGARRTVATYEGTDVNDANLISGDGRLFAAAYGNALYEVSSPGTPEFVRELTLDGLPEGLPFPAIAIDDGFIWSIAPTLPNDAAWKVLRVPLAGGTPEVLAGVQIPREGGLTLSDTHVYFFDGPRTIRRVSRDGGQAQTLYVEPDPDVDLQRLHVGDGFLVFERNDVWDLHNIFAIGVE